MRSRWIVTILVAAALASAPAAAQVVGQNDTGTATETQERHSEGRDNDLLYNLIGLLGLLGLRGLWRKNDNDGYTADPV